MKVFYLVLLAIVNKFDLEERKCSIQKSKNRFSFLFTAEKAI